MATLLQSPDLLKEYIGTVTENSWFLDGNKWLWERISSHYGLYKTIPSFNILQDYVNRNTDYNKVPSVAAGVLLTEYQSMPPADIDYFKSELERESKYNAIRNIFMEGKNTPQGDIDLPDMIERLKALSNSAKTLPPNLNLKELMTKPSDDYQNLLNNWAFERQAIIGLVAGTGIGKSVMTMQLATHFACGKETLRFTPHRKYKTLVIQNEDSDNDISMMRDGAIQHLTASEIEAVYSNLEFIRLRGYEGSRFLDALDTYCSKFKPDIVFVNPLLKYLGFDPNNPEKSTAFLNQLEPLLEQYNCGMILVTHTTKQSDASRKARVDDSYNIYGSAVWSNSVRDTISIKPSGVDGYWHLTTSKRSSKWDWRSQTIKRSTQYTLPHWYIASIEEQASLEAKAKSEKQSSKSRETIFGLIQPKPITMTITELIERSGLSDKSVRNYVKDLVCENRIESGQADDKSGTKVYYRK